MAIVAKLCEYANIHGTEHLKGDFYGVWIVSQNSFKKRERISEKIQNVPNTLLGLHRYMHAYMPV